MKFSFLFSTLKWQGHLPIYDINNRYFVSVKQCHFFNSINSATRKLPLELLEASLFLLVSHSKPFSDFQILSSPHFFFLWELSVSITLSNLSTLLILSLSFPYIAFLFLVLFLTSFPLPHSSFQFFFFLLPLFPFPSFSLTRSLLQEPIISSISLFPFSLISSDPKRYVFVSLFLPHSTNITLSPLSLSLSHSLSLYIYLSFNPLRFVLVKRNTDKTVHSLSWCFPPT